jgi:Phytochelatin synthase
VTSSRKRILGIWLLVGCLASGAGCVALRSSGDEPPFRGVSIKASGSYQDARLLNSAWQLPVARAFRPRMAPQNNPSSCGPSSLANIQRSFGEVATEASVLQGTGQCWFGICAGGLTLDELAELGRVGMHRDVQVLRDLSYPEFLEQMGHANDPKQRVVINFHRAPLFGEGHGHFSPVGGYLAAQNLVLVLDVNAKYKPFLVDARRLFEAMDTVDASSSKKRGLLIVR